MNSPPPLGQPPRSSGQGAIVLVLGILSFVGLGCLTGLPAWIMGNRGLVDLRNGLVDPAERGNLEAGRLLGIISTGLTACGLVIFLPLVLLPMFAAGWMVAESPKWRAEAMKIQTASAHRQAILDAAVGRRKKNPKLSYTDLASDLTKSNGKEVKWHLAPLKPIEGCGAYRFSGANGALTITDDCGESSIYGWPAQ